jgi:hypothetical protein
MARLYDVNRGKSVGLKFSINTDAPSGHQDPYPHSSPFSSHSHSAHFCFVLTLLFSLFIDGPSHPPLSDS